MKEKSRKFVNSYFPAMGQMRWRRLCRVCLELKSVVQHKRTHIRLGHLWFGLARDVLRCLLWVNPFLTVCQKQFRADMEDICDRACIQGSGRTAHEYGMVLLKTLKLLRSGRSGTPPAETV